MRYLCVLLVALSLFCFPVFANTIGFSLSQAVDDSNLGVYGDYETDLTDILKFGIEGQFQKGDEITGNADVALTLGNDTLGVRLESINKFRGHALADIGRTNSLGASLVFPIAGLEISGGIFGQTGNPFQTTYELSDPTDPTSVQELDSGILIKEGSTLNLALKTEFDYKRLEVSVRGLFEIAGEGDRYHQLDVGIETGGSLTDTLGWTVQGEVIGQLVALPDGALLNYERSILASIQYSF